MAFKFIAMAQSNFTLKWDNAPAIYGAIFGICAYFAQAYFAVGTLPLSVVVRLITNKEIMNQTVCPHCNAGINRFRPKVIVKINPTPWYKPMSRDIFIVCSSCGKCVQYKRGDAKIMLFLLVPMIASLQDREPVFGYYVFFAILIYVAYVVLMQMFSDSVYVVAKKQLVSDANNK